METAFFLPSEFLAIAHQLADAARPIIQQAFRRCDLSVESKEDRTPVTPADKQVEEKMRQMLGVLRPADGIFGEEFGRDDKESEYHWVLDPIDGTKAFAVGGLDFGTLIGLHHATHGFVLGIMDHAITGDRWIGIKGQGATRNNQKLAASRHSTLQGMRASFTNPVRMPSSLRAVHDHIAAQAQFMHYGGNCLNYGAIADGLVHATFESAQNVHDVAALIPIITEAGGVITYMDGTEITLCGTEDKIIAACTPELHRQLCTLYKTV